MIIFKRINNINIFTQVRLRLKMSLIILKGFIFRSKSAKAFKSDFKEKEIEYFDKGFEKKKKTLIDFGRVIKKSVSTFSIKPFRIYVIYTFMGKWSYESIIGEEGDLILIQKPSFDLS